MRGEKSDSAGGCTMKQKKSYKVKQYNNRKLTTKQRAFILEYMANGHNATRAAIAAGYSPKGADVAGWTLVHVTANVSEEINRLTELAYKKSGISAAYILGSLKEIAEACKMRRVERNEEGEEVTKPGVIDSAGANRALELLGKNQKLFIDSMELTRKTDLQDLTDEELLKIIKNSAKNIK